MLDPDVAKSARDHLTDDYNTLKDLPTDLADTIANLYYFFYADIKRRETAPQSMPSSFRSKTDFFAESSLYIDSISRAMEFIKNGPELIHSLRDLRDDLENPNRSHAFVVMCAVAVDQFKYGIDEPMNKIGARRLFERFLKRNNVREISNLASILGLR